MRGEGEPKPSLISFFNTLLFLSSMFCIYELDLSVFIRPSVGDI